MRDKLIEASPGVFLTDTRAAAEALFRDLTDGWIITTQNGLIDCIEEHLKAYNSSLLADLAIARRNNREAIRAEALKEAADRAVEKCRPFLTHAEKEILRAAIYAGEVKE